MALLTITTLDENTPIASKLTAAGLVAAAAGGDQFQNDGNTFLLVVNGNASAACVVTVSPNVTAEKPPGGGGVMTKAAITATIPESDEGLLGPFPPSFFNGLNACVTVTYSQVTTVKVLPVRLARS